MNTRLSVCRQLSASSRFVSTACVDDHRAAVQEKDTARVKRLAHEAKRDKKLKYRTVVLEVISRLPRRDRVSHSGVEDLS